MTMASPLLDSDLVTTLGRAAFPPDPRVVVYADREPRPPGPVLVATETVRTEHPTVVVFRDEMPGANWMHPCTYALVDVVTRAVLAREPADRPPAFGTLPETWVVVSDPNDRADLVRRTGTPHPRPSDPEDGT